MPSLPPSFRPPGQRTRRESRQAYDAKRRRAKPWRKWYCTAAWARRRKAQLARQPYCERCDGEGRSGVIATVANHVQPHRGDWSLFIAGALQSLCKRCHDSEVQREERGDHAGEGGQKV